ncbi:polysaccharide deacetylase family protein [Rhizobacter fulvus]
MLESLMKRATGKVRRTLAVRRHRRDLRLTGNTPTVSFTFDDAPRTALVTGAAVLEAHGARGTYYLSLALLSTTGELGPIAEPQDLERAVAGGHELGCHTFDHHDAWSTTPENYIASVDRNRAALHDLLPGHTFHSFAYPKSGATAAVKPALAKRFACCRGGGQTFNTGTTDLNLLNACFIDRRARVDLHSVSALIDRNAEAGGWLIFAAHDIAEGDAAFGCSTSFFETIVQRVVASGSRVLTVSAACEQLRSEALA